MSRGKLNALRPLPPEIGGYRRKPFPRFTVLSTEELSGLRQFFQQWGELLAKALVPGGHVFIASNPFLSPHVAIALMNAGSERRGEIVRLVRTLRGGDLPIPVFRSAYGSLEPQALSLALPGPHPALSRRERGNKLSETKFHDISVMPSKLLRTMGTL
jgi:hypothetical protein